MNLSSFISDIDFSSPSAFQLLFAFKKKDHNQDLAYGQETAEENKTQKDDYEYIMQMQDYKQSIRIYKKR